MDVSYIFSADELFTLMSLVSKHSEAGRAFGAGELADAVSCDLSGLVKKKMAKHCADGEMELSPVIRMLTDALASADSIDRQEDGWLVRAPWVTLRCAVYPYRDDHYIITPMKEFE